MLRLSDEQWERIRDHFPEENIPASRPGRKPIPTRKVLDAVLWILNTGAQWHMLPQAYPNYKTVHRRFQTWCRNDVLRDAMTDLANALRDEGALDESECFIDATFASAKGGGDEIGPTKRGKGVKCTVPSRYSSSYSKTISRRSGLNGIGEAMSRCGGNVCVAASAAFIATRVSTKVAPM